MIPVFFASIRTETLFVDPASGYIAELPFAVLQGQFGWNGAALHLALDKQHLHAVHAHVQSSRGRMLRYAT
jgi:hypothetical protein